MTWFDIIDSDGVYVAEAEGIENAQGACEQLVKEGYGKLRVVPVDQQVAVAHASWDEEHQLFLWRSSTIETRYRLEGREARR